MAPTMSQEPEDRERTAHQPNAREGRPQVPDEEAARRSANIFLLVAAAVFVGIGIWLVNAMVDARRADECMSSGRRNCSPIEAPPR